ncbi:MAG: Mth938-like domain-containing protein [Thermoplasmatota archaeon]
MHIDSYSFGKVIVDGTIYTSDVIIYPDHVQANWRRRRGHLLQPEDLSDVIATAPDTLIIGTGAHGRMTISEEARQLLNQENISFEVLPTEEACQAFNKRSNAVAALHLTC